MGQVKPHRKTSLPGVLTEGEIHFVSTGGGASYVQYVINNSGQAIPPATLAHSHVISDVTGLQAALDSKGAASGTTGTVAQFTGAAALGNSPLTVSGSDVTAAAKVRATTSYVIPAIGTANTAYISGNFDAFVPVGLFGTGVRPGYGFYAAGVLGTYLYAETGAELHLRTNTGQDYTMWNSGNLRSDAQNDSRYVQSTRALTINGTTYDLSANRSWTVTASIGSGTNGFVTKWNGSVLADSSIDDSDANFIKTPKGAYFGQGSSRWYFSMYPNTTGTSLYWNDPTGAAGYVAQADAGGLHFVGLTAGYFMSLLPNQTVEIYKQLKLSISTGTAPFQVFSTTMTPNLNADMVDGLHASSFALASALSGYVPTTRTLTINGTTFDLSANRSWTISGGGLSGTVNYYARFASGGVTAGDGLIYDNGSRIFVNGGLQMGPSANRKIILNSDPSNSYIFFTNNAATPAAESWISGQSDRLQFAVGGTEVFRVNYASLDTYFAKAISIGGSAAVLNITSTTMVPNFNADMVDGVHASSLVQTSRTITINGVTYDLSANRSWTISGGGSTTLAGLSDVFISSPQPYESLVYVSGMWRNYSMNGITGTGTAFKVTVWDSTNSIKASSIMTDSGSQITIGGHLTINNGVFNMGTFSSAPSSPVQGSWYFDTALNKPRYHNGSSWVTL